MRPLPHDTIVLALLVAAVTGCGHGVDERPARASDSVADSSGVVTGIDTLPPCDGPCPKTAADVQGVYVMVEEDGRPLPSTTHYCDPQTPGRRCTAVVESDTLTLREDGTFQQRGMGRNWCNDMPTPTRSTADSMHGTFGLYGPRGDSIAMGITALDPPVRLNGVLTGNELRVVTTSDPSRGSYRYVRLR